MTSENSINRSSVVENGTGLHLNELKAFLCETNDRLSSRLNELDDKVSGILKKLQEDVKESRNNIEIIKSDIQNISAQEAIVEASTDFQNKKSDIVAKDQEPEKNFHLKTEVKVLHVLAVFIKCLWICSYWFNTLLKAAFLPSY